MAATARDYPTRERRSPRRRHTRTTQHSQAVFWPGDSPRLGNYKLGGWYDHATLTNFESGAGKRGSWGYYGLFDQVLVPFGTRRSNRGFGVFGSVTVAADSHVQQLPLYFTAGVSARGLFDARPLGQILARRTKAETDNGGRVKVKPGLTIPNCPDIYVIGDLASPVNANGKPLPGLAQVAMRGGIYAATAILRKVKGQPELPPFHYFDKGSLAVIGRWAAVANAFGVHLSGLVARIVWAFIHLMYIVTFQNRLLVFIQWAIQDLTFSRGARLITGVAATDFNFNKEVAVNRRAPEVKAETVAVPHWAGRESSEPYGGSERLKTVDAF